MLSIFRKHKSYGAYVKTDIGFELLDDTVSNLSINNISSHLGYDPFLIHTYHGNFSKRSNIEVVALEVFTDNVVFILVRDKAKKISTRALRKFFKKFDFNKEYDSVFIRDYLLEGISNRSLSIHFLSKVLELPNKNPNEEFTVKKLGVKLFFVKGYLASFKLTNDLEEWARHFQNVNKHVIANYAKLAKKYWNDNYDMIYGEVNIQSESLANTPSGYKNEFIPFHRGEFNTVNFLMLLVCHYNQKINETQFVNYNYGRYVQLNNIDHIIRIYRLGQFDYFFNHKGELLRTNKI